MKIETLSLGPIGTNCYILSKKTTCLIVDPGGDANVIKDYISKNNLTPEAILLTNAHFDHIGAVDELRQFYHIDVFLNDAEKYWLENIYLNRLILYLVYRDAYKT